MVKRDREQENTLGLLRDIVSLCSVLKTLGEHQRALEFAYEGVALSRAQHPAELRNLCFVVGELHRGLGNKPQAMNYFEQALEHSPYREKMPLGSSLKPTTILNAMANTHLEQGDIQECLRCHQDAIDWARRSMTASELALSLRQLGLVLLSLNRHSEALPHFEEGAAVFGRLQDQANEAVMQRAAARVFERLGDFPKATVAWERALMLQRQNQNVPGQVEALEGLGGAARKQDESPGAALPFYREALELAKSLNDLERQADLHNTLGIIEWRQGCYENALGHYQQALQFCDERADRVHAALMLNSIGVTLQKVGRLEEAIAALQDALSLHRETKKRLLEGHALAVLGDIYFDLSRFDESAAFCEESLRIRRELNDRKGEGWMLHHLARARAAQEKGKAAQDFLGQARKIAEEHGLKKLSQACRRLTEA